jgi:hypothetical protein
MSMRRSRSGLQGALGLPCLVLLLLAPFLPAPRPVTALAPGPSPPLSHALHDFLNADGTLDLDRDFRGPIAVRGGQLVSGPGEASRFAADDHRDARFSTPGTTGAVTALALAPMIVKGGMTGILQKMMM